MKYKIGDKVKYDGGDWWFYGTVSAIFEHAICPCYRLNVEKMEKKNCKFSVTQFEFELEPDGEIVDKKEIRKWENLEVDYLKKWHGVLNNDDLAKILKRTPQEIDEKWKFLKQEPKLEIEPTLEPKPKRTRTRKPKPEPQPQPEKPQVIKPEPKPIPVVQVQQPVIKPKLKRGPKPKFKSKPKPESKIMEYASKRPKLKKGEAWDNYYARYKNGEKTNIIYNWVATNRRDYQSGKLTEAKLEKLIDINFPFESPLKKKK